MSIFLYSGTPGSGKSYEAVNMVFKNLEKGLFVIANFAVKFTPKQKALESRFFYMENKDITVHNLLKFAVEKGFLAKKQEHQCLVVIDEAGGRFNCRKNMDREYKTEMTQWVDFFSQHMKMGFDFILVAQMDRMIDRQIRGCIETEYKFKKVTPSTLMNMMPFLAFILFLPIILLIGVTKSTWFIKVEYWYMVKQRIGCSFIRYSPKKASRYDRFKMFSGFAMSKALQDIVENLDTNESDSECISAIYADELEIS